jgi:hypothetical protein
VQFGFIVIVVVTTFFCVFFPQGLLHFGFDVVVTLWLLLVFSQGFVHFGYIVVVVMVITFFWFLSRFCAFMFKRKKVKIKGFLLWLRQQQLEMGGSKG